MFFQHIYDKTLAQASYLIGCQKSGEAIVIDPKRDVDTYLEMARHNGLRITHITETHIHADFLSGSRELAALTGAKLYLSNEGGPDWQYEFDHVGLSNGDVIHMGNLTLEVIHTPGHTPESISFLLTDLPASNHPVMLFTGDFVFVGDVGRPDLLEKAAGLIGTQAIGARQLFDSLAKFSRLPDFVQVWPGHGAGSACGKSLGAVPSTTVGYEKVRNWAFQQTDNQDIFVRSLLSDQPEPPRYFAQMKKLNKVDRPLLTVMPIARKLTPSEVTLALEAGVTLIDTRNKMQFAEGFVPGSLNIQGNNAFATWMGWMVDYQKPFMLVANDDQMEDLTRKLMRIGLDHMLGYITDVSTLGIALDKAAVIDLDTFKGYINRDDVHILDMRGASEYRNGHVPGAQHLFVGNLSEHLTEVSRTKPVIIYCQGGDRATIGYSLLRAKGFTHVYNYAPGMNEWIAQNNPVEKQ